MIKVRIDKAEKGFWYENQIGNTLTLHENSGINNCRYTFYEDLNIKLEINESDCTVIQEEEFPPYIADQTVFIGGHQKINSHEPTPFDMDKWQTGKFNVQTQDGRKVEIFKTAAKGESPIIGIVTNFKDEEYPCSWSQSGRFMNASEAPHDLLLIPKTKVKYVNVYESMTAHDSLEKAATAMTSRTEAHIFMETKEVICNE